MKKILLILFFSFCISLPAILPFFHVGYFPTHDGEWAVVRLGDMFRTLRDFQIPARYSGNLNFGYGYPLFNFTYPFPYYFGVILHSLGFGFVNTIKILFAGSVVFSGFFMFLAAKLLWKSTWAGIASSILYIYFPYRMVDLYVRGSIGESLSFVLFPLLFYLTIKLINKPSSLLIGCIAASLAILIMTHNIMTVLFLPLYLLFVLIQTVLKNKKAVKPFLISLILSFGLSAFFWVPALLEKANILLSRIPIADRNLYFVKPEQLILPGWGYGVPTDPDGFSYQLGIGHLTVLTVVVLFLLLITAKHKKDLEEYFVKSAGALAVAIIFYTFLLFKSSDILWKNLPLLSEINYPWINLGILGFLISLLAGFLCNFKIGKYILIVLVIITIYATFSYAKPQYYIDKGDDYYLTNDATTTSSNELMPLWVKKNPLQRPEKKTEIINGSGFIENVSYNSRQLSFSVNSAVRTDLKINTIYYPGWRVLVDNTDTQISYNNEQGVMEISVSPGIHSVSAKFNETPLRLASDIISLVSLLGFLILIIKKNKYAFS